MNVGVVTIRQAMFVDQLAVLFVVATSSAAPDADLFVMVPGCRAHAAMGRIGDRDALLREVQPCGDLDGWLAIVSRPSSHSKLTFFQEGHLAVATMNALQNQLFKSV